MHKFTKRDLAFSVITGFIAGTILWRILIFLETPSLFGFSTAGFIILVPIFWILGVNLGYFLGKWMSFFNQFGKFAAIGFTNAAVDFGILNLLIGYTGIESGWEYSVFKSLSFIVAVTHSYFWNKYWVFEAGESGQGGSELFRFLAVNIFGIIINVGIASLIVNFINPVYGFDAKTWANIGAVVGSASALLFTFFGARLLVFKKSQENQIAV